MLASAIPSKIQEPFAINGTKNTIPVASQIGITPGAASFNDGFPPLTMTPLASGGVPPDGADVNGILNVITAVQQWQSAGGIFKYDSTFSTAIGGYPAGAMLLSTDGVTQWLSLVDNNTTDPDGGSNGGSWMSLNGERGLTAVTGLTNANITLSGTQFKNSIITLSGTLTGNIQIIFPNTVRQWMVINNTSGNFTITCKTAAGTGIIVPQGATKAIYGDGTNILDSGILSASSIVSATRNAKMVIAAASASATFTADEVIVKSVLGGAPSVLANYSQTINLATTGAGGMDTGTAPINGFVAVYASITSTGIAGIFACNVTTSSGSVYSGANAPAGVVKTALVAIVPTNGTSQFVPGVILDRKFMYQTFAAIFTGHASITTMTSQSIAAAVPAVAKAASIVLSTQLTGGAFSAGVAGDATGTGGKAEAYYLPGATYTQIGGAQNASASLAVKDVPLLTAQTIFILAYESVASSTVACYVSDYTF